MGLVKAVGQGPVFLDTAIFIYFIEENEKYFNVIKPLFEAIDSGRIKAVTSGITLLETLVVPFRAKDDELANQYEKLLTNSFGLTLLGLDTFILRQAALLRAVWSLKTPDAIQIAAAQKGQCSAFVTNDRRLPKIKDFTILQVSDF